MRYDTMKSQFSGSYLLVILGFIILGLGCSSNEAAFKIDSFAEFTIPAGANPLLISVFETEVIFPYEAELGINGFSDAEILAVNADNALLFPQFEAGFDLDFIHVVEVFAVNQFDSSDDKEVFFIDPADLGRKTELRLFPSLPNIKEYVRNERMRLRVEVQFRRAPTRNLQMFLDMEFSART